MLIKEFNKKVRIDNVLRLPETVWESNLALSLGF